MRTLFEFQNINKNNLHLNCNNIRKKAGKCAEYFTDEEINNILQMFILLSKKRLTNIYIVDYLRYQILCTVWVKEVYANGYLEYENVKYGDFLHFKNYVKNANRRELIYSKTEDNIINQYDNNIYELKLKVTEDDDGDWKCIEYWEVVK